MHTPYSIIHSLTHVNITNPLHVMTVFPYIQFHVYKMVRLNPTWPCQILQGFQHFFNLR
ncbi:hypothetical protein POUND7_016894 [Theobroma cacao]